MFFQTVHQQKFRAIDIIKEPSIADQIAPQDKLIVHYNTPCTTKCFQDYLYTPLPETLNKNTIPFAERDGICHCAFPYKHFHIEHVLPEYSLKQRLTSASHFASGSLPVGPWIAVEFQLEHNEEKDIILFWTQIADYRKKIIAATDDGRFQPEFLPADISEAVETQRHPWQLYIKYFLIDSFLFGLIAYLTAIPVAYFYVLHKDPHIYFIDIYQQLTDDETHFPVFQFNERDYLLKPYDYCYICRIPVTDTIYHTLIPIAIQPKNLTREQLNSGVIALYNSSTPKGSTKNVEHIVHEQLLSSRKIKKKLLRLFERQNLVWQWQISPVILHQLNILKAREKYVVHIREGVTCKDFKNFTYFRRGEP